LYSRLAIQLLLLHHRSAALLPAAPAAPVATTTAANGAAGVGLKRKKAVMSFADDEDEDDGGGLPSRGTATGGRGAASATGVGAGATQAATSAAGVADKHGGEPDTHSSKRQRLDAPAIGGGEPAPMLSKIAKDPTAPTEFLPDAEREKRAAALRAQLKKEWLDKQEQIRSAWPLRTAAGRDRRGVVRRRSERALPCKH
jgi:hypothetical protein